jgi:hypothetical protein
LVLEGAVKLSEFAATSDAYKTDKFGPHSYANFYDVEFDARRLTTLYVLEIGVAKGGSLRLWHDWFRNAYIQGVDTARCWTPTPLYPRLDAFRMEAYAATTYAYYLSGPWDIVIDDGSHKLPDQKFVLEFFPQHLRPGGILIIEDVQAEGRRVLPTVREGVEVIEYGGFDDCLVVWRAP